MADPVSTTYTKTGPNANFEIKKMYVSCIESSSADCKFDKCCIEWSYETKVKNGHS
jgi:hypothetical protein